MSLPTKSDTEMSSALSRYLRLNQEQEALRARLTIDPFTMPPPLRVSTSPDHSSRSLSTSPVSSTSLNFPTPTSAQTPTRRRTITFTNTPSPPPSTAVSITCSPTLGPQSQSQSQLEAHLLHLTHAIKATLTELLNSPTVRHGCDSSVEGEGDGDVRGWIQARLMDTEMELKAFKKTQGRRRTSSISECGGAGWYGVVGAASFGIESLK